MFISEKNDRSRRVISEREQLVVPANAAPVAVRPIIAAMTAVTEVLNNLENVDLRFAKSIMLLVMSVSLALPVWQCVHVPFRKNSARAKAIFLNSIFFAGAGPGFRYQV